MDTNSFKDKITELLSSTGFSTNLRRDKFKSLKSNNDLKPILEFIENNLSSANCVTPEELQKYEEIQRKRLRNHDSYENEGEALQEFYTTPVENLFSFSSLYLDDVEEELNNAKTELKTKESLKSMLSLEIESQSDNIIQQTEKLNEAKIEYEKVLSELYSVNKELGKSLSVLNELAADLTKSLSSLVSHSDVSADEGIDTMQDKPTFFSSTLSLNSACSSLDSISSQQVPNEKPLFCQMNLMNLEKDRRRYEDRILALKPELEKILNSATDTGVDIKLKFKTTIERLADSKFRSVKSSLNILGYTEARRKIRELHNQVISGEWKMSASQIKNETYLLILDDYEHDLDEEFNLLMESCKEWSTSLMLKPSCDYFERSIKVSSLLTNKLDEINKLLGTRVVVDAIVKALIQEEVEMLEKSTGSYELVLERMSRIADNTSQRIETMDRNSSKYSNYCLLPLEERCGPLRTLANMLKTEPGSVKEAIDKLDQESRARHDDMMDHCDHQVKTLFTIQDKMKALANTGLRVNNGPEDAFLNQLARSLNSIQDLSREVNDVNNQCSRLKEN